MRRPLLAGTAVTGLAPSGSGARAVPIDFTLQIAVDRAGSDGVGGGGAGGGGVVGPGNMPLVIAGGGRRRIRRKLASITPLRNARHFALALRGELQWRTYTQTDYAKYFAVCAEPWNYSSTSEKIEAVTELLLEVGRNGFDRALEIGCAQGAMTARLAPLCKQLLAVDFVPLALERARARCRESNVSFAQWDLKADAVPGTFDLIVITDVLGSLGGRRDIWRARNKLVSALDSGGYLLYGDYDGDLISRRIHDSWWARLIFLRPGKILRIFAAHPALVQIARRDTERHLLALFQKRAA